MLELIANRRAACAWLAAAFIASLRLAGPAAAEPPASPASSRVTAVALTPEIAARMDARLVAAARLGGTEPVPVWIALADKGERSPADLARMLDEARAALTPRNLARRMRAHVVPLVDDRDIPVHAPYLEALAREGLAPYGVSRWQNAAAARIAPARLAAIAALPFVAHMSPVERGTRAPEPLPSVLPAAPASARLGSANASYGLTLAQLSQIAIPALHDSGYTGAGVLVCVIDDGFNYYQRQEALRAQPIAPGFARDFVEGDLTVQDTTSFSGLQHGSWTFGILGGNKPGTYLGAAYGASYALARTEVDFFERQIEMVYWQQAAEWADSLGADLISSSLAYRDFDPPDSTYTYAQMDGHTTIVTQAAEIAASKGILVVNAVGNDGATPYGKLLAPSDVNGDSLIAVGAVDGNNQVANFSSRGPSGDGRIKPDLVALGVGNPVVNVQPPNPGPYNPGLYTTNSGTSFSTPLVAGLAACLLQARPASTPVEIIRLIRRSASQALNPDNAAGYGLPSGLAALRVSAPIPGKPVTLIGPNPFHAGDAVRATFDPSLVTSGHVRVIDIQGHQVRVLRAGGSASPIVLWDGRDDDGRLVRPGIYFLASGHRDAAARVVFLR